MQNQRLINGIKSQYILRHILHYVKDNKLQYKLFAFSKLYQKKADINIIFYKRIYLLNIFRENVLYNEYNNNYNLKKKYNEYILKKNLNKKELERLIYEINNEDGMLENPLESKKISVDSPLFEILSKTKNFASNYTLYINQNNCAKSNLKKKFLDINKLNINYSSIYFVIYKKRKIYYLKRLNIDFSKIKRMSIKYDDDNDPNWNLEKYQNNNYFFENLFSINNIENNLIFLYIHFKCYLDNYIFEKINSFKSLQYLYLHGFEFDTIFYIKLKDLKVLYTNCSKNILISEEIVFKELKEYNLSNSDITSLQMLENSKIENLEKFLLMDNKISDIKLLVKLEKIKLLYLEGNNISDINCLENAHFNELKKLIFSFNNISDISALEKVKLEKLEILYFMNNNLSDINALEFAHIENLKELNLFDNNISDIRVFENVRFEKLERLHLGKNKITDINVLEYVNFKELKELYLDDNNISDIKVFRKIKFEKLKYFNLQINKISVIPSLQYVNFKYFKITSLTGNIYDYNNIFKFFKNVKIKKLFKLKKRYKKI